MCVAALRARGVDRIALVEPNERRRAAVAELGATGFGLEGASELIAAELGEAPRHVLESAGHPSALPLAIELVATGGIVALLGVHEEPVEISQLTLIVKEAQIRACMTYRPGDFDEAIELIASGRVPVERLVTAREPLERANELFDELTSGSTAHLKVLLRP
jgi:threonine dehydrogenase-like Zn-dependent dehydrogenase